MRLLLDTAAFIYAAESPHWLTKRAARAVQDSGNILELSSISLSEIAIKAALGKLRLSSDAVWQALKEIGVRILPYSAEHAFYLFELPLLHADPFDRHIIAQALSEKIPVVTPDDKFSLYREIKVIW